MNLTKKIDETLEQFEYRILKNKDTLGFNTWEEIANLLNSERRKFGLDSKSESFFRKAWNGYEKYNAVEQELELEGSELLNQLKQQREDIAKEKIKVQTASIELNRLNRQNSRFEMFYESVRDSIKTLKVPDFIEYDFEQDYDNEYVLGIADIHCGAEFEVLNNKYSLAECRSRFNYLLNKTVQFVKENAVEKLNVLELGDSVQGILRCSDLKLNETSVVESVVFVAKLLANFLNKLSKYCKITYYHVLSSNHSQNRNLGTKANELATEDMEYIIFHYIKDSLVNNDNVECIENEDRDYQYIKLFDFECIAMHGHQLKNLKTSLQELTMLHKKFFDYLFVAHYHAGSETVVGEADGDCEVLVCPSFVGSDPYSQSLRKGSKAACKIFTFDKYNGHIRTDKIILN